MNLLETIHNDLICSIQNTFGLDYNIIKGIELDIPKKSEHGDLATNAAMVLASILKDNPKNIAEKIKSNFEDKNYIKEIKVEGPGFINLFIDNNLWLEQIKQINNSKNYYGNSSYGTGKTVNLEFVSANPTGPLHIGHVRGAVYGDTLARLLRKIGYSVHTEYYVNDAGNQIKILVDSARIRYKELLGHNFNQYPDNFYPGQYLVAVVNNIYNEHNLTLDDINDDDMFSEIVIHHMLRLIQSDLDLLDIKHNEFVHESKLKVHGFVNEAIDLLVAKNLVCEGYLEKPKDIDEDKSDWVPEKQTLFKSTNFGDDNDRSLIKSNGDYTYFASDVAYHYLKLDYKDDIIIDVFGADHSGYVKRIKAAVDALADYDVNFDIITCQMVSLLKDGSPFKMSKRENKFVTLREVYDQVGKDVIRFFMLTKKNTSSIDFDFSKVVEESNENPVYYIQYALARANSIREKAKEIFPEYNWIGDNYMPTDAPEFDKNHITDNEIDLIKKMCFWPSTVLNSAKKYEPHLITYYLIDLCGEFHKMWTEGKKNKIYFLNSEDENYSFTKLQLISAFNSILKEGFDILNIDLVEKM